MLASLKFIDSAQAHKLLESYTTLRRTEHRLQVAEDKQTHVLPEDQTKREQLAIALDFTDWNTCYEHLENTLSIVHQYFEELFMVEGEETDSALT